MYTIFFTKKIFFENETFYFMLDAIPVGSTEVEQL